MPTRTPLHPGWCIERGEYWYARRAGSRRLRVGGVDDNRAGKYLVAAKRALDAPRAISEFFVSMDGRARGAEDYVTPL